MNRFGGFAQKLAASFLLGLIGLYRLFISPLLGDKLSAFANMLTICERCGNHTWTLAWILLCAKTYFALSPLGQTKG